MLRDCKHHGKTSHAKRKDRGGWRCRKCSSEAVARRKRKIKKDLVELHGGGCKKCGYNKCMRALHFHHRDPKQKLFELNLRPVVGWKRLLEEAKKCDLLCANCHMEEEDRIYNNAPVEQ